jgi:hypothetical protein
MNCCDDKVKAGLQYATTFDVKLLGVGCDVEVVVDIESGSSTAMISMRAFMRSIPAFRISLASLTAIVEAIKVAHAKANLLQHLLDGANDHQLNFSAGGASLVVVHPKEKKMRFVLSIGSFTREGELDKLSAEEVTEAVEIVQKLVGKTREKVLTATR